MQYLLQSSYRTPLEQGYPLTFRNSCNPGTATLLPFYESTLDVFWVLMGADKGGEHPEWRRVSGTSGKLPARFRKTFGKLPGNFRKAPETLKKRFQKTSGKLPENFRKTSGTLPERFRKAFRKQGTTILSPLVSAP